MIVIAIAWMYVVVLMAATQPTWLSAFLTLFGYGLFPLSIVLYLVGTPGRRRRTAAREAAAQCEAADQTSIATQVPGTEPEERAADLKAGKDQTRPPTVP